MIKGYRRNLLVGDRLAAGLAVAVTVYLRFDQFTQRAYEFAPLIAIALWLAILAIGRTYEMRFLASGS